MNKLNNINRPIKTAFKNEGKTQADVAREMELSLKTFNMKLNLNSGLSFTGCERFWLSQHYGVEEKNID